MLGQCGEANFCYLPPLYFATLVLVVVLKWHMLGALCMQPISTLYSLASRWPRLSDEYNSHLAISRCSSLIRSMGFDSGLVDLHRAA